MIAELLLKLQERSNHGARQEGRHREAEVTRVGHDSESGVPLKIFDHPSPPPPSSQAPQGTTIFTHQKCVREFALAMEKFKTKSKFENALNVSFHIKTGGAKF